MYREESTSERENCGQLKRKGFGVYDDYQPQMEGKLGMIAQKKSSLNGITRAQIVKLRRWSIMLRLKAKKEKERNGVQKK